MSTPNSTRSSPCFHPEDPDAIKTANGGGSTIRKDMQRLNIKAEVYNPPPMTKETQVTTIWPRQ